LTNVRPYKVAKKQQMSDKLLVLTFLRNLVLCMATFCSAETHMQLNISRMSATYSLRPIIKNLAEIAIYYEIQTTEL